ncbi:hypothetical protein [Orlajensenia leifsoniae]|uniref:Fimbrial assembly protein n=1 Tax=Orlajensenia leifsoniae TaxID=2561933 RepID=A0A4Y9R681_9MICO|nr:hypothetical protein [Leifsonia flava]TFW00122.1 hypothetical protein E4M00_02715 [Leifsonia flava]
MSAVTVGTGGKGGLTIGGMPTVDLLPLEVRAGRKSRTLRRWLIIGVIVIFAVVALAIAAAFARNLTAQLSYAVAQERTIELTKDEAEFADVFAVKQLISTGQEAQHVVGASEIDWQAQLASIVANLPANSAISTVAIEQGTPMAQYAQAPIPMQNPRIATISFTVDNPGYVPSADMLDGMTRVVGYADAQAVSVSRADETSGYKTQIVLHLDTPALTNRFTPKEG